MRFSPLGIVATNFLSFLILSPASADYQAGEDALIAGDYAAALAVFRPLAEQGDPEGQYGLGMMYGPGRGVPQNAELAFEYFNKAALQGHIGAQLQMGIYYGNGYVVSQNQATALIWYTRAAELGNAEAQWNVGVFMELGQGTPVDYENALIWFWRAAAQGFAQAMFHIGRAYYLGNGTPKDIVEAYKWMFIRALFKDPSARAAMDTLAKEMSNSQVAAAVARGKVWGEENQARVEAEAAAKNAAATAPANTGTAGKSAAGSGGTSLREKLLQLKELEEAGLITKEEAARKREKLLEDL